MGPPWEWGGPPRRSSGDMTEQRADEAGGAARQLSSAPRESAVGRLVAIGMVWVGCTIAWIVLGTTLVARSGEASFDLTEEVHALWGAPMTQRPPRALRPAEPSPPGDTEDRGENSAEAPGASREPAPQKPPDLPAFPADGVVPLTASNIEVELDLEHRRKGLVWFPTYVVDFAAAYTFTNTAEQPRMTRFEFPLQSDNALYDGFEVSEGGTPIDAVVERGVASWSVVLEPGARRTFDVRYRSRGTGAWHYEPTAGTSQVKGFRLAMKTDFGEVDFPPGTLSPSSHTTTAAGWSGSWDFKTLVASAPIGVQLPERLNPGPLVARITFFAPVSLLFFFFVVAILAASQERRMHPLNYFFLGCAFFAFHLLFSYLVDHLAILPSFAIASGVSLTLVVSYARLFVGWKFALREVAIAQLLYLVLFSFSFFWTGFTGLAVTVGAIVTLFVMMQITGRKRWGAQREPRVAVCPTPYRCRPEESAPAPS